ncbi:uncharacterized protein LOC141954405 isoform X2 [Strix uralensis]
MDTEVLNKGFNQQSSCSPQAPAWAIVVLNAASLASSLLPAMSCKLLFYHNPLFNRDDPNLTMFTQCAGGRKRAPAAPPLGPEVEEDHPRRRRCPEAQLVVGAAEGDNDTRTSATTSSAPTELWAGTTAPRGSAGPPPTQTPLQPQPRWHPGGSSCSSHGFTTPCPCKHTPHPSQGILFFSLINLSQLP